MNIYVGNLNFRTTDAELLAAFQAHGEVSSARIMTDRATGESRGFGFVEMPNDGEAKAAMEALDGSELDGRTLKVNVAREKQDRPRGGGRRDRPRGGGRGDRSRGGGGRGKRW